MNAVPAKCDHQPEADRQPEAAHQFEAARQSEAARQPEATRQPEADRQPLAARGPAAGRAHRRVFNFSPGPAALPTEVLEQAAGELLDWRGLGVSVMEISHRSKAFIAVAEQAEADLRSLLGIPEHYKVLFMQGGAIGQNAIVPLNLMAPFQRANYLISGQWSARSAKEAARYGEVAIVADSRDAQGSFLGVTPQSKWRVDRQSSYLHLCLNETIDGVAFDAAINRGAASHEVPPEMPVVADVSSTLLSEPLEVERFGLLYGGAQKNIGPAGLSFVIVREDLLGKAHPHCPSAFDYQTVSEHASMYNTPPTFAIYLAGLVFGWLLRQGGLAAIAEVNRLKAALIYHAIDNSSLYFNRVEPAYRSRMNVVFFLRDASLNEAFLVESQAAGLFALKGHRVVGGMRASIYNAVPLAGVHALVDFMCDFERRHG
jgi:phosphoserine aminotransferase